MTSRYYTWNWQFSCGYRQMRGHIASQSKAESYPKPTRNDSTWQQQPWQPCSGWLKKFMILYSHRVLYHIFRLQGMQLMTDSSTPPDVFTGIMTWIRKLLNDLLAHENWSLLCSWSVLPSSDAVDDQFHHMLNVHIDDIIDIVIR